MEACPKKRAGLQLFMFDSQAQETEFCRLFTFAKIQKNERQREKVELNTQECQVNSFNIRLQFGTFRRQNSAYSPNQLKEDESKSRYISSKMESFTWLGHWWGQPKQATEEREGLEGFVLGLRERVASPWCGVLISVLD